MKRRRYYSKYSAITLPAEIWENIFIHLSTKNRANFRRVCRLWNEILLPMIEKIPAWAQTKQTLIAYPHLKYLDLKCGGKDITDDDLSKYGKNLRFLDLDCVDKITDKGLKNLIHLQGLDLGHPRNPITENGIAHLTNLWYLGVWTNINISRTIVQKLPNITHIDYIRYPNDKDWSGYGLITEQDLLDMGRNDIIKNSQSGWTKEKESRFTNFLVIEDDD